jgi:(p)ppGpp synthase/HD superfamily hydrolase
MDDDNQDLLERAIACAFDAHAGQKYPSPEPEPYILHPLRVMCAVDGAHARMAAVLHDVIEDTEVTLFLTFKVRAIHTQSFTRWIASRTARAKPMPRTLSESRQTL